jgi:hypothetical protein
MSVAFPALVRCLPGPGAPWFTAGVNAAGRGPATGKPPQPGPARYGRGARAGLAGRAGGGRLAGMWAVQVAAATPAVR